MPVSIIINDTDALSTEDYTKLYSIYKNYKSTIENDSYESEIWFIPYTLNEVTPLKTITDAITTIYFQYSEAWELTCDLDDVFTIYTDDTISEVCDKYYQDIFINTEGMAEKEIVNKAIKAIRNKANYDYTGTDSGNDSRSMVGYMSDGKIVCAGYSRVLQYLLTRSGIECIEVIGSTVSENMANTGDVNHSWNKVKIDDKWYNIDVCWADTAAPSFSSFYLFKSNSEFENLDHWASNFTDGAYKS